MEHVSKSEAYLYAIIFDPNIIIRTLKTEEGEFPKIYEGGGGGVRSLKFRMGGARFLRGGQIPRDLAPGRAKSLGISPQGGQIPATTELNIGLLVQALATDVQQHKLVLYHYKLYIIQKRVTPSLLILIPSLIVQESLLPYNVRTQCELFVILLRDKYHQYTCSKRKVLVGIDNKK